MSNCSRPEPGAKLIVFVRAPRPGTVKTRLAAAIGPREAAEAYQTLVGILLEQLAHVGPAELYFAPENAGAEIRHWLRPGWSARPQEAGDLGARMSAAFEEAFAEGAQRVALIGSDCPEILDTDIQAAWDALREHDVVLGPALDGGYWLIGLRQPQPALFNGVSWSTGAVLRETLDRVSRAGLRAFLLRTLRDIDTEEDWQSFRQARSLGRGSS